MQNSVTWHFLSLIYLELPLNGDMLYRASTVLVLARKDRSTVKERGMNVRDYHCLKKVSGQRKIRTLASTVKI